MITQYEAGCLLREQIPQLAGKTYPSKVSLEIYAFINYFSEYTRLAVQEHNFNVARKCFNLAEKLFRQGDRIVRMLIENVFVYGFTSFLPSDKVERLMVRSIIPETLYSVYIRQVNHPDC